MKSYSLMAAGVAAALCVGDAAAERYGWHDGRDEAPEVPFSEAHLFFELNDTDGDLGIHSKIDGEPWAAIEIEDPHERRILSVRNSGRLRPILGCVRQGPCGGRQPAEPGGLPD